MKNKHSSKKQPPRQRPAKYYNGTAHNTRGCDGHRDDSKNNGAIMQVFQEEITRAMDNALVAMDVSAASASTTGTTQGDTGNNISGHEQQQQRLSHLWQLEASFQSVLQQRLAVVKQQLRSRYVEKSILLPQPEGILGLIGSFLDEVSLHNLEESCSELYRLALQSRTRRKGRTTIVHTSAKVQRPPWYSQWQYLDQLRDNSKSSLRLRMPHPIRSSARSRGILWAKASRLAEFWESQQLQCQNQRTSSHNHSQCHHNQFYERDDFVYDFGRFFQHQPTAPIPPLEFFIRISVPAMNKQQHQRMILLEGFQSNFMSLRHIHELQDQGHHTYIAVGQLVSQAVMVRHNPIQLATAMGLKRTTYGNTTGSIVSSSGLDFSNSNHRDSDEEDDEDELDEDDEWPQSRRRAFLNRATITIIRCGLPPNQHQQPPPATPQRRSRGESESNRQKSANITSAAAAALAAFEPPTTARASTFQAENDDDDEDSADEEVDLKLVGTTTGFSNSEQHFGMFHPIRHHPTGSSTAARAASAGRLQHNLNAIITGNDDDSENSYFSIDGNDDNYDNDDTNNHHDQALGIPLADDEMVMLTRDGRLIHQDPDHPHGHQYRLKIGLGCSEGDGLHIVFKWEWD